MIIAELERHGVRVAGLSADSRDVRPGDIRPVGHDLGGGKAALSERIGEAFADEVRERTGLAVLRLVHRAGLCHHGA